MAYTGSVELISGIKQANNGTFPLVDASAVRVTDSKRLDVSLNDIGNDKADKSDTVFETTLSRGRKATTTVGTGSFAFGSNVEASGNYSHAEGNQTVANHYSQHVFGEFNSADDSSEAVSSRGNFVEIVGNGLSSNARSNARALDWSGNEYLKGDLYLGCNNNSTGGTSIVTALSKKADKANPVFTGSISLGRKENTTVGNYSVAEGYNTEATFEKSHAEGNQTKAAASGAHSEGFLTVANASNSHAEGNSTYANAESAHSEGFNTSALGHFSHTEGTGTNAANKSQHVFGEYNIVDPSGNLTSDRGDYVEIVGNGTGSSAKSNARTLDWSGNEYLKGDLYINCDADSTNGTKVIPLPPVTSSDDGSILCVVDGEWTMLPGAFTKMEKTISGEMLPTSLNPGESKSLNFLSTDIPDCMIKSTVAVKTASFSDLPSSVVGEVVSIGYSDSYGINYRVKLTNESESAYVYVSSDATVSLTYSYYSF